MKHSNDIFTRHNPKFVPKELISHLLVQNGVMLLVFQNKKLQHVRIQTGNCTDLQLPLGSQDKISNIFLDHRGMHAIVTTKLGENFYLNTKSVALRSLKKMKGQTISAVGFNSKFGGDDTTGFIVLGTTKGVIMETVIDSNGQQHYLKTLSKSLCQGKELPVSSVHIGPCSLDNDNSWMILICIPGQVYCLTGNLNQSSLNSQPSQPLIGNIWSASMIETQTAVLNGFFTTRNLARSHATNGTQTDSTNNFCIYPVSGDDYELPEKYAWLSSDGISAGSIKTSKSDGYEMISQDWNIPNNLVEGTYKYPVNIALSEYHVLVLYSDRFAAISLLNQKVAFEDVFQSGTKIVGMARDISSQFIWVYTETQIFNYRPVDEARDVWRILLDKNDFVAAQKITKQMPDPRPYQIVIKKLSENFLAQQNFVGAAELLAKSCEPFENTVMKFLKYNSRESRNGLKSYLDLKLNSVNKMSRVQRDILIIWLLEIQLSELAELRRNPSNNEAVEDDQTPSFSFTQKGGQIKKLRDDLYFFLNRPNVSDSIGDNRSAVYRLITSHVDFETQLYVANKLKDYDVVVKIYLLQNDYKKALEIIATQLDPDLFYKYAEDLFEHVPREFVATLMNANRAVKPGQIITIFFNCYNSIEKIAAAFVYLNNVVNKDLADQATHDFLIKLYAESRPNSLLEHLKKFGKNKRRVPYNIGRALGICVEKKLMECCVFLYCLEEMYEMAVKLALTIRVELAKECAIELNQSQLNDHDDFLDDDIDFIEASQNENLSLTQEAKKHVWLEIAKYMIQQNYDISQCMELLKESNNVIKIQDILSFFPEFTKIEHFKEPLCNCLKEHASKIQELQKDMAYVSESAVQLRNNIDKSKSNVTVVKTGDKCTHCGRQLLTRPFFIFNCRHFLHYTCTIEYLRQCFSKKEQDLLDTLLNQEQTLRAEVIVKSGREKIEAEAKLSIIKRKIKEFVADQCPLCGHDRLSSLLAKPIISEQSYQKSVKDWAF